MSPRPITGISQICRFALLFLLTLPVSGLFFPHILDLWKGQPMQDPSEVRISDFVYSAHPDSAESKALPLKWLLDGKERSQRNESGRLVDRILARLIQLEAHEPNPHLADDYRQTFIALSFALKGYPAPFVEASYVCYGLHPDQVWPAILERRAALLGRNPDVAATKKPCASVGKQRKEEAA